MSTLGKALLRPLVRFAALALVVNGAVAESSPPPESKMIYGLFVEYRQTLTQPDGNPSAFFSRRWNEIQLARLTEKANLTGACSSLPFVQRAFRFGRLVDNVHDYSVTSSRPSTRVLRIIRSSKSDARQAPIEITYVLDDGEWKINHVSYEPPTGTILDAVIDSFAPDY